MQIEFNCFRSIVNMSRGYDSRYNLINLINYEGFTNLRCFVSFRSVMWPRSSCNAQTSHSLNGFVIICSYHGSSLLLHILQKLPIVPFIASNIFFASILFTNIYHLSISACFAFSALVESYFFLFKCGAYWSYFQV